MKKIITLIIVSLSFLIEAQNVGINSTGAAPANCAMLDISASDKGLLVPRVALTNVTIYLPLIGTPVAGLLVYSTAAPTGGNGTGYYYWTGTLWANLIDNITPGNPWYVGGNIGTTASTAAYGSTINNSWIGTQDSKSMVFGTNNLERMRINPTDGEVVIGAQTSGLAGDLLCGVSNSAVPWAINGYSGVNGSGIYGQITGGTTLFAGVQGEYYGSNAQGAGVRGIIGNTTPGTSWTTIIAGVYGGGAIGSTTAGTYKMGVYGNGGYSTRSGGVIGNDGNFRWGAAGYYAASFVDYSIYGFGTAAFTGISTGRMASTSSTASLGVTPNNQVGLGIYGGVMGGWIKGLVYGTNFSGQKYGVYVHGNSITNEKFVQLNNSSTSDNRIASYATTALTNELTSKGKISLINGQATVIFDVKLMELCDLSSLVITATPMGNCNGVFIDNISENGFVIKEINNGLHNVSVSFIISGTLKQATEFVEPEILSKQYEVNMNGVMHNDYDNSTNGTPIWFDGIKVRHDAVDEDLIGRKEMVEKAAKENEKLQRPKNTKSEKKD